MTNAKFSAYLKSKTSLPCSGKGIYFLAKKIQPEFWVLLLSLKPLSLFYKMPWIMVWKGLKKTRNITRNATIPEMTLYRVFCYHILSYCARITLIIYEKYVTGLQFHIGSHKFGIVPVLNAI